MKQTDAANKRKCIKGKDTKAQNLHFHVPVPCLDSLQCLGKKKITCCLHASNCVHKMEAMPLHHDLTRINWRLGNVCISQYWRSYRSKSEKHVLTSTEIILLPLQMEHSCRLSHQLISSEAAKEKLCLPVHKGAMACHDSLILNEMNVIGTLLCAECTTGFGFLMQKEAWRLLLFNSATEIIRALYYHKICSQQVKFTPCSEPTKDHLNPNFSLHGWASDILLLALHGDIFPDQNIKSTCASTAFPPWHFWFPTKKVTGICYNLKPKSISFIYTCWCK